MNWHEYFVNNAADQADIPWALSIRVEPQLRLPLIRSLQRFQVGEQGDGKHLIRAAQKTGDANYAATVELFVKEEQHHAQMLARLIQGMNGTLLKWHWSDVCFVFLRRLLGLRLELLVLLSAEMVAKRYYRVLYEGTSDPVLRAAFARISHDELGHLAFHCDYLQRAFSSLSQLSRLSICWLWCLFFTVVCLVVARDHRDVIEATGGSMREFRGDCGRVFDEISMRIFHPTLIADQAPAN
jgi:hypothetical protein